MPNLTSSSARPNPEQAPSSDPIVDPRLLQFFTLIQQTTGIRFVAASMAEQMLASTPGGAQMPDGRSLLGKQAANAAPSVFDISAGIGAALFSDKIAQTLRHDGAPLLCGKFALGEGVAGVLECGFTNIVLRDRPTFALSIASASGFTREQIQHLVGAANPKWTMLVSGGPDITFLSRPNARLYLSPQSFEECVAILTRAWEMYRPHQPADDLLLPQVPGAK